MSEEQALFFPEQLNFFLPSIRECDQRWSVPRLHRAAGPSAAEGIFLLYILFHIKTLWFPTATCRSPFSPPALQGRFARLPELPSSLPRAMTCFNPEFLARLKKEAPTCRQPASGTRLSNRCFPSLRDPSRQLGRVARGRPTGSSTSPERF